MKPKINFDKMQEHTLRFQEKTKELANQAAQTVQQVGNVAQRNIQDGVEELRLKILNPIFAIDLHNNDFIFPQIIHVVEFDKRQNDPLCQGSIGWIDRKKDMEVLHLYYSSLQEVNLQFYPSVICDSVYYVDLNKNNIYVNVSDYFDEMQKSKFAELEQIAFKLGARKFVIEIQEASKQIEYSKKQGKVNGRYKKDTHASIDSDYLSERKEEKQIHIASEVTFTTSSQPTIPELMWYQYDKQVQSLINMRCYSDENHQIASRKLKFDSKATKSLSISTAAKIDAVIKELGFKSNFSLKSEAEEENRKTLIFNVEF